MQRLKHAAVVIVGLAVSVGFAYLAARNVDRAAVLEALRESDYRWLVPATALFCIAIALRCVRWWCLFAPPCRPPLVAVSSAFLIGMLLNNVLPARAGDGARLLALRQSAQVPIPESAATTFLERIWDVLSVLVLLFVILPWLPRISWIRAASVLTGLTAVAFAAAVGLAVAVGRGRTPRIVRRLLAALPSSPERLGQAAANLSRGLEALRRPRLALLATVLTFASWLATGVSFWFVMRSFSLHLSLVAALLVLVAVTLGMILPSSPAALGVFEAATVTALTAYHVPESRALSYALVLHALNIIPYLVLGYVALHHSGQSLLRRRRLPAAGQEL